VDIFFPNSPERLNEADPSFASEQIAARAAGFGVALYSHESIEARQPVMVSNVKSGSRLLLRGWMMSGEQHEALASAITRHGAQLVVNSADYTEAHYLPHAYRHLWPDTAESIWMKGDDKNEAWSLYQKFRDTDALIKDWVKSAKHRWKDACFLPAGTDRARFSEIFHAFRQARGHLFNRGVVFRRYVPLATHGTDMRGFPLVEEFRLFFFQGALIAMPDADGADEVQQQLPRWTEIAKKFRSPFVTIDVAKLDSGNWIVVEAGDGGVSGLPLSIDPEAFYQALARETHDLL
jgi:hypothetical protein